MREKSTLYKSNPIKSKKVMDRGILAKGSTPSRVKSQKLA